MILALILYMGVRTAFMLYGYIQLGENCPDSFFHVFPFKHGYRIMCGAVHVLQMGVEGRVFSAFFFFCSLFHGQHTNFTAVISVFYFLSFCPTLSACKWDTGSRRFCLLFFYSLFLSSFDGELQCYCLPATVKS